MAMDEDAGLPRSGVDSFGGASAQANAPAAPPPATPSPAPPPPSAPAPNGPSSPPTTTSPTAAVPPVPRPVAPPPPLEIQVPDEAVKAYIERCVVPQQKWFSKKAAKCKRAHNMIITAQVVATTSIPLLNMVILKYPTVAYVSTAAAAVSGLAAGVAGFGKFKEHWLRYRQNSTALENLQLEYELRLPPFQGLDRNNLLIENVRRLLAEEQKLWIADVRSGAAAKAAAGVTPIPARPSAQSSSSDDDDS